MLPAYKCVPAGIPFHTRLSFPNPCSFFPAFALPINHSPQLCFRKILLIRKDCFQPLPLFPLRFPAAPAALHSKTTSFQLSRCSSCPLFAIPLPNRSRQPQAHSRSLQPEIPALNCFDTTKNRQHIFCPCRLFFLAAPPRRIKIRTAASTFQGNSPSSISPSVPQTVFGRERAYPKLTRRIFLRRFCHTCRNHLFDRARQPSRSLLDPFRSLSVPYVTPSSTPEIA